MCGTKKTHVLERQKPHEKHWGLEFRRGLANQSSKTKFFHTQTLAHQIFLGYSRKKTLELYVWLKPFKRFGFATATGAQFHFSNQWWLLPRGAFWFRLFPGLWYQQNKTRSGLNTEKKSLLCNFSCQKSGMGAQCQTQLGQTEITVWLCSVLKPDNLFLESRGKFTMREVALTRVWARYLFGLQHPVQKKQWQKKQCQLESYILKSNISKLWV